MAEPIDDTLRSENTARRREIGEEIRADRSAGVWCCAH
jgi:hypothetical protein